MDIRILKYFLAIVKEENIIKAAQALHITQPTLSRQLMDLENELNCKLFNRSNRKITLTNEGFILYKRAQEIITLVDKTTTELKNIPNEVQGDIYIGAGESDTIRLLAKTMYKIQQNYPNIRFHIISGNIDDLSYRLNNGILDFCIFFEAPNLEQYNYLKLPFKDNWGVIMRKDSHLCKEKFILAKMLTDLPLIVSSQSLHNNELTGWLNKDIKLLHIVATYNLIYNATLMVEEGLGYALAFDKLINVYNHDKLCFRPLFPKLEANIALAWKKHQTFSKPAQLFLDRLQQDLINHKHKL